eukprot:CAMPEP_0168740472 /NCGR_PEP_ID=MMETSP0724-20121128/12002_1 /TAXON_ID=265536 /ORGANISM="Amphiprora sp., Strain CCMP467" /LENGTH=263 /DNA_ID=CAMNT_0008787919 /DNA_START=137 /DNA_END=928 /DNA_ORIENTATION=+
MAPVISKMMVLGLAASASAFSPMAPEASTTALFNGPVLGAGGMADTRDPDAVVHEDPRKSISDAPSFEEYLKQRAGGGGDAAAAPAAAAPVAAAAAPVAAAAPASGGTVVASLQSLQGPGMVWGAEGVEQGKEESELKGYDNFDKFYNALQATGVAAELAAGGPYTIFAPTNSALEAYEQLKGPIDATVVKMQIVPGKMASSEVRGDLTSLAGPLSYRYAVRKHFLNDAIIGEKSFGPYPDFPVDVECSDGVIHAVGMAFALY